jgi:hypothetical protein
MNKPTTAATWRPDNEIRPAAGYKPGEPVWAEVKTVWVPAVVIETSNRFVTVRYRLAPAKLLTTSRMRPRYVAHDRTEIVTDLDGGTR